MPSVLCTESDVRVGELRRRLDEFYRTTTTYDAFNTTNTSPVFWAPVLREIDAIAGRVGASRKVRVLEFGAGKTAFGDALGARRDRTEFHIQDVTPQNADFLKTQGDVVHIGDALELKGPYDVVFSTFVWEHVTNPRQLLSHLLGILSPGGSLFIASPRYDFPLYVPPSARHYGMFTRAALVARLQASRMRVMLGGHPDFYIHTDPSLFHGPWYRDADAIHWASIHDLRRALPAGYQLTRLGVSQSGLKGLLWSRFLLLFVQIRRLEKSARAGS